MKVDIWMPVYLGDYLKATMGLDATGHGQGRKYICALNIATMQVTGMKKGCKDRG